MLKHPLIAFLLLLLAAWLILQFLPEISPTARSELKSGTLIVYQGNSLAPISPIAFPKTQVLGVITSYNPFPEQTDDNPDITASGHKVREGIVANNCLPFGTRVEIDGEVFVVLDRMNSRYGCEHFDILSFDYEWSVQFGRQYKEVVVY